MPRYSEKEKIQMIDTYEFYKSYSKAARCVGCAMSTVYYAVNPDKYERHKEHVYLMQHKNQIGSKTFSL